MQGSFSQVMFDERYMGKLKSDFETYRRKCERAVTGEVRKLSKLLEHKKMFSVVWLIDSASAELF